MTSSSMLEPKYRSGAHSRDTDECSNDTTSTASSTMTADDLLSAERTLGMSYSVAVRSFERRLDEVATELGYGPRATATAVETHRQRLVIASKQKELLYVEEKIDQIDQILQDGRLLDMSEDHYQLLRAFSSSPSSSKASYKVEIYDKRLRRYARSNLESTKQQVSENITKLAFKDEFVRELLSMGAVNVRESFQRDPALWINCGASLQRRSRTALVVPGDAEVHTLLRAEGWKDEDDRLQTLIDHLLKNPTYFFVAVRYLRQIFSGLKHMMDQAVINIAKAIDSNCDNAEFEECDCIFEKWLDRAFGGRRIDECSAVLEIILRYSEKLPVTVSSKYFQEWFGNLMTVNVGSQRALHAHYVMGVLLKGIAAANRSGDEGLLGTNAYSGFQPLLHVLKSLPDLALSTFAYEEHDGKRRVPGAEKLNRLCDNLITFTRSINSPFVQKRAWHCAKALLTTDIYCHTAMLKALSLAQIRHPKDFASYVDEVSRRLHNTPDFSTIESHYSMRHCDAEGRVLHIVNDKVWGRCDSTRGCLRNHEIRIGWEDVLTLHLGCGIAFSSTGHHPILAGRTVDDERAYVVKAQFGQGYEDVYCFITEGTKPENLRIQTKSRWREDERTSIERTPISLDVYVLRWAPNMYAKNEDNIDLDATGPFSWEPFEDHVEAYISEESTDLPEEDGGSPKEVSETETAEGDFIFTAPSPAMSTAGGQTGGGALAIARPSTATASTLNAMTAPFVSVEAASWTPSRSVHYLDAESRSSTTLSEYASDGNESVWVHDTEDEFGDLDNTSTQTSSNTVGLEGALTRRRNGMSSGSNQDEWDRPPEVVLASTSSDFTRSHALSDIMLSPIRSSPASPADAEQSPSTAPTSLERLLRKLIDLDLTGKLQAGMRWKVSGGYADVFLATLSDGTSVAVKRFRLHLQNDDPRFANRATRELRIWRKLHHTNVLPLRGFIREETDMYPSLITDWMENGTMAQYIQKNAQVDNLFMIEGVANGLLYLHSEGVVHGDLKATNVMISPDGVPMLIDFGISHLLLSTSTLETATDARKGSFRWLSPELIFPEDSEQDVDIHTKESDVWAFGMTGLEVLTKMIPYAKCKLDAQVAIHIHQGILPAAPDDIREWKNSDIWLWNLCRGCWLKDPRARPTVSQLLDSLKEIKERKS